MRQATKSALSRLGYSVTGLADGVRVVAPQGSEVEVSPMGDRAWLVSLPADGQRRLRVDRLDDESWVVQRRGRGRRTALRMGPEKLRTHLLVDRRAARANMRMHQSNLSSYLAGEHIAWVLRSLRINCVFDVGANMGQFGQSLRAAGYRGRIVSFEPLPHLAEQLRAAAAGDPDWHVHECGLGEESMVAEMTVVAGAGKTSSLLPASDFGRSWRPRLEGIRKESVQIRTLTELYDEAVAGIDSPRTYLKMDTQGYDLPAFRGAGERINDFLGMQSEVACLPLYEGMARMPEQLTAYEDAGFEITGMFPVSRERDALRVIEFDVVMVRPEAGVGG